MSFRRIPLLSKHFKTFSNCNMFCFFFFHLTISIILIIFHRLCYLFFLFLHSSIHQFAASFVFVFFLFFEKNICDKHPNYFHSFVAGLMNLDYFHLPFLFFIVAIFIFVRHSILEFSSNRSKNKKMEKKSAHTESKIIQSSCIVSLFDHHKR